MSVQRKLIQVSTRHLFNKAHSESGHLCFLAIDPSTLFPKSCSNEPDLPSLLSQVWGTGSCGVSALRLLLYDGRSRVTRSTTAPNARLTRVRLCKKRSHITRESKGDTDCSLYLTSFKRRLQIGVYESLTQRGFGLYTGYRCYSISSNTDLNCTIWFG